MNRHGWIDSLVFVIGLVLGPFALPTGLSLLPGLAGWQPALAVAIVALIILLAVVVLRSSRFAETAPGLQALVYLVAIFFVGLGITASVTDLLISA